METIGYITVAVFCGLLVGYIGGFVHGVRWTTSELIKVFSVREEAHQAKKPPPRKR